MAGSGFGKVSHAAAGLERKILRARLCGPAAMQIDRRYNFWGTIAVTEVTDFEAPLLVQSRDCHK
jgi:hypothetical protein